MTVLTARKKGANSDSGSLHDATLEAGGINVNQDAYDAALDRIYDVKGLANMHVEIDNTHATNGLIYKIEKARKEFTEVSELATGDFDEDIVGDTIVAALGNSIKDIIDISPETTAIRIRVKRQTASNNATLGGIVSVN